MILVCAGQGKLPTYSQSHQDSVSTIESFLGHHHCVYFKYMWQFKSTSSPTGVQQTKPLQTPACLTCAWQNAKGEQTKTCKPLRGQAQAMAWRLLQSQIAEEEGITARAEQTKTIATPCRQDNGAAKGRGEQTDPLQTPQRGN